MKNNKSENWFWKLLDNLTGVKYNGDMLKLKTDPEEFEKAKSQYEAAVRARQEDIEYLFFVRHWKLQKIADFFNIDIAQVSRLITKLKKEREEQGK